MMIPVLAGQQAFDPREKTHRPSRRQQHARRSRMLVPPSAAAAAVAGVSSCCGNSVQPARRHLRISGAYRWRTFASHFTLSQPCYILLCLFASPLALHRQLQLAGMKPQRVAFLGMAGAATAACGGALLRVSAREVRPVSRSVPGAAVELGAGSVLPVIDSSRSTQQQQEVR